MHLGMANMEDQEVVDTQAVDLERADEEKTPSEIFGDPPGRCGECEEVDPECMERLLTSALLLLTLPAVVIELYAGGVAIQNVSYLRSTGENTTIGLNATMLLGNTSTTFVGDCPSRQIFDSNLSEPDYLLLALSITAFALACFPLCFYSFGFLFLVTCYWGSVDRWRVECDPSPVKVLDDIVHLLSVEAGIYFGGICLIGLFTGTVMKHAIIPETSDKNLHITQLELTQPPITPIRQDDRSLNGAGPES